MTDFRVSFTESAAIVEHITQGHRFSFYLLENGSGVSKAGTMSENPASELSGRECYPAAYQAAADAFRERKFP